MMVYLKQLIFLGIILQINNNSFSIITVCYNSEKTIEATLLSVLNQTYKNFEYIIIDGKSNDSTLSIINKYKNKIDKIISEKDHGIYDALNKGIAISKNDIVGFLHSGDVFTDNKILADYNKNFNSETDIVFSNLKIINYKNNKIIRNWKSSEFRKNCFFDGWTPPHPTFYAKRNCFIEFGSFNTQYKISSDIDLMFRFLEINNLKSKYIDIYSVLMETGGLSNKNFVNKIKLNLEIIQILKKENKSFSIISFLIKKLILKSRQYF